MYAGSVGSSSPKTADVAHSSIAQLVQKNFIRIPLEVRPPQPGKFTSGYPRAPAQYGGYQVWWLPHQGTYGATRHRDTAAPRRRGAMLHAAVRHLRRRGTHTHTARARARSPPAPSKPH